MPKGPNFNSDEMAKIKAKKIARTPRAKGQLAKSTTLNGKRVYFDDWEFGDGSKVGRHLGKEYIVTDAPKKDVVCALVKVMGNRPQFWAGRAAELLNEGKQICDNAVKTLVKDLKMYYSLYSADATVRPHIDDALKLFKEQQEADAQAASQRDALATTLAQQQVKHGKRQQQLEENLMQTNKSMAKGFSETSANISAVANTMSAESRNTNKALTTLMNTCNKKFQQVDADIAEIKTDTVEIKTDIVEIKTDIRKNKKEQDEKLSELKSEVEEIVLRTMEKEKKQSSRAAAARPKKLAFDSTDCTQEEDLTEDSTEQSEDSSFVDETTTLLAASNVVQTPAKSVKFAPTPATVPLTEGPPTIAKPSSLVKKPSSNPRDWVAELRNLDQSPWQIPSQPPAGTQKVPKKMKGWDKTIIRAYMGSSKKFNQPLRDNKKDADCDTLTNALGKLEPCPGAVVRCTDLPQDVILEMEKTGKFSDLGFLSTSRAGPLSDFGHHRLAIISKTGRNVTPLLLQKEKEKEQETLFLPHTVFSLKGKGVDPKDNTKPMYFLVEDDVQPHHPRKEDN